jgi:site-specific DNA recombinase
MQKSNDREVTEKIRPAIYLRVSTEDQWNRYGLDLQKHAIDHFIKTRADYTSDNIPIYIDQVSWTFGYQNRPELKRLFDDLKYSRDWEKPFDVVVVYKIDRFARDLKVLLDVIWELSWYGVSFASTQEMIDTSTPFWKAMLWILWVFAELDRDMIVEKTQAGIERAVEQYWVWYRGKFGYDKDGDKRPITNKEQAKIVKRIFLLFTEQQYPVSKICDTFTKEQILIPKAWEMINNFSNISVRDKYRWNDKTVRWILSDEVYTWKYYFNKTRTIKDRVTWRSTTIKLWKEEWRLSEKEHAPIIDQKTFDKAQILLDQKRWNYQDSSEYVLWWLIKCDYCKDDKRTGMVWWTWTSSNGSKFYICSWKNSQKYPTHQCSTIPIPKEELEQIIKEQIKDLILNPEAIKKHSNKIAWYIDKQDVITWEIDKINQEINKLKERWSDIDEVLTSWKSEITWHKYNNLVSQFKNNLVEFEIKRQDLQNQLSKSVEKEKQVRALEYVRSSIGDLEAVFSDNEKCKELFKILIDNITIYSEIDDTIKITGRKKQGWKKQAIPKWIIVNFKLPQEFLNDIFLSDELKNSIT